ncbi:MAG: hypothetical protein ACJAWW_001635 [Sulfurimonas sp.]|jgi:hypothetical protein
MNTYKTFICIDDTDEIGYYKSTGQISEEIQEYIQSKYAKCSVITRHQLFIHEDIPYTSHNSSMCFTTELSEDEKEDVTAFVIKHIEEFSAPTSQPGICIGFEKDIRDAKKLIEFGFDAKTKVLTKEDAYSMAKEQKFHLSEHKNDGQGVIGAVAGIALRLYGSDGRVKGNLKLKDKSISVKELLEHETIDEVQFADGTVASSDIVVHLNDKLKRVMLKHKTVVLIQKDEDAYKLLTTEQLRDY